MRGQEFESACALDEREVYGKTLQFVLIKAVYDLFENARVIVEHSLGKGIFGEIIKDIPLNELDILKVKNRMREIINRNLTIKKVKMSREEAIEIFKTYGMLDKVKLFEQLNAVQVELYCMDGRYDYFYGELASSTGFLNEFNLVCYNNGFILLYPGETGSNKLPEIKEYRKLNGIFRETKNWQDKLHVSWLGSLNQKIREGRMTNIINVSEAFQEKKIVYIADMITERKPVKIVLISGPSSSGKTTFSKRLSIQLAVNGYRPLSLSLDDYFVDRPYTPKDEDGNYDFESIYALDIKLFNKNLKDLMEGKEVELPSFNFKKGRKEWKGRVMKLPRNGIILIEGIHGLNKMLTSSIPSRNKFSIYVSALTQLNLDDHNRISTTDVRIIRRMVRDNLFRGYSAEDTLKMWPSVKKGEEKNIFVFQENADVMFNSTLVYELGVLKKYALDQLDKISTSSSVYCEASRLSELLHFFEEVEDKFIPGNSILREFIGGSCFYN